MFRLTHGLSSIILGGPPVAASDFPYRCAHWPALRLPGASGPPRVLPCCCERGGALTSEGPSGTLRAAWTRSGSGGRHALPGQRESCLAGVQPEMRGSTAHSVEGRSCNPYGFIYPQDLFPPYKRRPASGIQDKDVQLADVAPQLLKSMFTSSPNATADQDFQGLLVSIEMRGEQPPDIVLNTADWEPDQCTGSPPPVCPGCDEDCVFNECEKFDVDCILSPKGGTVQNIRHHAENGQCQCLDPDRCPSEVEKCLCPDFFTRTVRLWPLG